ncbi:hypothetical protein L6452_15486 [Arctium lappa]|uniref:Uncharacterized protein n=1 Tax=Arctium lappa TaxID=4217 RepID=A0ACB9CP04_ARCLA|nr:hypothetical protein L6452_15486 [Arctium lappa]
MSCQSDYNPPSTHAPPIKPHLSPPTATTTHRSSDGNSTTSHQSETAATASMDDNDTPPPLQLRPPPPPPPSRNTSFPVREDCWSEDATFTLIEAWGDRYVELNRGNLRQKHWQEVADAVNGRHGHTKKARRTDIQCKNRIDTLKKKYKVEKSKVLELGHDHYVSPWPFFAPLDSLIGSSFKPSTQTPTPPPPPQRKRISTPPSLPALPPPPSSVPVGPRSKRPAPPPSTTDSSFFRRNFSVMAAAAIEDSDTSWSSGGNGPPRRLRMQKADHGGGDPYHQLAEAIARFAEVYQRVEEAKQKQMVELEKHRLQFTKDLELQRMKLLMESQLQLEKMKRSKRNPEPDFCRSEGGDQSASIS